MVSSLHLALVVFLLVTLLTAWAVRIVFGGGSGGAQTVAQTSDRDNSPGRGRD